MSREQSAYLARSIELALRPYLEADIAQVRAAGITTVLQLAHNERYTNYRHIIHQELSQLPHAVPHFMRDAAVQAVSDVWEEFLKNLNRGKDD